MFIRNSNHRWAALAVGLLVLTGASLSARAGDYCDGCDSSRWQRFCSWCSNGSYCNRCHRCRSTCRCYRQLNTGFNGGYVGGGYNPYAGYSDPRDSEVYAAQGYNAPIAVPLAPCVKHTWNYGWGLPSSRLTRVGAHYDQWYPTTPFSQTGGYLPAGGTQTIYQPTDTTQLGYYYVHVPHWGRYGWY